MYQALAQWGLPGSCVPAYGFWSLAPGSLLSVADRNLRASSQKQAASDLGIEPLNLAING